MTNLQHIIAHAAENNLWKNQNYDMLMVLTHLAIEILCKVLNYDIL